jgi:hypothetical protein
MVERAEATFPLTTSARRENRAWRVRDLTPSQRLYRFRGPLNFKASMQYYACRPEAVDTSALIWKTDPQREWSHRTICISERQCLRHTPLKYPCWISQASLCVMTGSLAGIQ